MHFWKNRNQIVLGVIILLCAVSYFYFGYKLDRTDYTALLVSYTILFLFSIKILYSYENNTKLLIVASVLFRLVFLFSIPNLSQDFYRFIWDGRMVMEGLNPYLYTPESILSSGDYPIMQAQELYAGMGELNGSHFTNYPPINQLCFTIAALFAGNSILGSAMVLRVIIVLADIGTLFIGMKLLEKLKIPSNRIFWYILNPFIVIELTGNLHFEGVMAFFLLLGLYLLHLEKWRKAAIAIAISISVKLIPLAFLPLLFHRLGFKKWFLFCCITMSVVFALFLPFFSLEFVSNYSATVGLWFHNFEFNASVYYVAREIGYLFRGYNEIATIGMLFSILVILFVVLISRYKRNRSDIGLITSMLFVLIFHFFTTTTMHPWYLATPLLLSVFTKYKFVLVWSFVIFLSYLAYANTANQENLWIIAIEYLVVYLVFFYEIFYKRIKV